VRRYEIEPLNLTLSRKLEGRPSKASQPTSVPSGDGKQSQPEAKCSDAKHPAHKVLPSFLDYSVLTFDPVDAKRGKDWASGPFPLVRFVVEGSHFAASPVVLSMRSAYFAAMFKGNWNESNSAEPIVLENVTPADFECILHFIYTGNLREVSNMNYLLRMLDAATFFDIRALTTACERAIFKYHVNGHSVCLVWNAVAEWSACRTLADRCMHFFQKEFLSCTLALDNKTNFHQLRKDLFLSALIPGLINVDSRIMVKVVREWAQANAARLNTTQEALEAELLPPSTLFNLSNRCSILGVGPRLADVPRRLALGSV